MATQWATVDLSVKRTSGGGRGRTPLHCEGFLITLRMVGESLSCFSSGTR